MKVPFIDLAAQCQSIKSEIDLAIQSVVETGSFVGGNQVRAFENNFAKLSGVDHCESRLLMSAI